MNPKAMSCILARQCNLILFACCSQKASIAELKTQLDEERYQRREEREKAAVDLKVSILRAQSEAQEELKRVSDAALRREREQQEVINKLQVVKNGHNLVAPFFG